MALAHLINNYEFRLEDESKNYRWFWETFQMPYESSRVSIRKRKAKEATAVQHDRPAFENGEHQRNG